MNADHAPGRPTVQLVLTGLAGLALLVAAGVIEVPRLGLAGRAPDPREPAGLYAVSSPFRLPIGPAAQTDPASPAMIAKLAQAVLQGVELLTRRWTVPVYVAATTTPLVTVTLRAPWAPAPSLAGVPIPPGAQADPSTDGHLAILDPGTGCEYDLWQASRTGQAWRASWANSLRTDGSGIYPFGLSARGSGVALLAGLVWPDELNAGEIEHALALTYPFTSAAGAVPPATETDGASHDPAALPEGARIQLDPGLDLAALHLNRYEQAIGRALQRYGAFVVDSGGHGMGMYAVSARSYHADPYRMGVTFTKFPAARFRVLALGPVTPETTLASRAHLVPTGCGQY